MGGGNRQNKSSSCFVSIFDCFKSKNKHRAGYYDYDAGRRTWPSDEDKGNWGVAEPNINMRADDFIRKYKKRVTESECFEVEPAV
ncbi:hypothetical protein RYX36_019777 [Vicia faba]